VLLKTQKQRKSYSMMMLNVLAVHDDCVSVYPFLCILYVVQTAESLVIMEVETEQFAIDV
jgi:hypothetical protein